MKNKKYVKFTTYLKSIKDPHKAFVALSYADSTYKERIQILKMLEKTNVKFPQETLDVLSGKTFYNTNFTIYVLNVVYIVTLDAHDSLEAKDYNWWKEALEPYVERFFDNSHLSKDTWLDKQLTKLQ